MRTYKEIVKLHEMLMDAKIPHEYGAAYDGAQVIYPNFETQKCSVVEHCYSYGNNRDRLEMQGLIFKENHHKDVEGFLTAEKAFEIIKSDFYGLGKKVKSIGSVIAKMITLKRAAKKEDKVVIYQAISFLLEYQRVLERRNAAYKHKKEVSTNGTDGQRD